MAWHFFPTDASSVEGKHLVGSVLVDAADAVLGKNIPKEVSIT